MGACNSVKRVGSDGVSLKDRVTYLEKTPFFLYLDPAQLQALAGCFPNAKTFAVDQKVHIGLDTIYVMCTGQLEMSTLLPTTTNKQSQTMGYLCKKVSGDIVNKKATNLDAKRKVRVLR